MTLSIPLEKLSEIIEIICMRLENNSMSRKQLESLIGKLLHISKCIKPARIFVSRLLETLRGRKTSFIRMSEDMRQDLVWFREFSTKWNGIAIINKSSEPRDIAIAITSTAIAGTDGQFAYEWQVSPPSQGVKSTAE